MDTHFALVAFVRPGTRGSPVGDQPCSPYGQEQMGPHGSPAPGVQEAVEWAWGPAQGHADLFYFVYFFCLEYL